MSPVCLVRRSDDTICVREDPTCKFTMSQVPLLPVRRRGFQQNLHSVPSPGETFLCFSVASRGTRSTGRFVHWLEDLKGDAGYTFVDSGLVESFSSSRVRRRGSGTGETVAERVRGSVVAFVFHREIESRVNEVKEGSVPTT